MSINIESFFEEAGKKGLKERLSTSELEFGVANFSDILKFGKNKNSRREPHLGDDFIPTEERKFYNSIGSVYPNLSKEQRRTALSSVLEKMDELNYLYVSSNHTPYIREPTLLSDINASIQLYEPGIYEGRKLIEGKNFEEVKKEIIGRDGLFVLDKVKSDFLVAWRIFESGLFEIGSDMREAYSVTANPEFLKRVFKGIITSRFAGVKNEERIERITKVLQLVLPERLCKEIEQARKEEDWILIK